MVWVSLRESMPRSPIGKPVAVSEWDCESSRRIQRSDTSVFQNRPGQEVQRVFVAAAKEPAVEGLVEEPEGTSASEGSGEDAQSW